VTNPTSALAPPRRFRAPPTDAATRGRLPTNPSGGRAAESGPPASRTVSVASPDDRWTRRLGHVLSGVASVVFLGDLGS
jgi:hypothetical protein